MRIISNNVNVKIGRQITVRDLSQTLSQKKCSQLVSITI